MADTTTAPAGDVEALDAGGGSRGGSRRSAVARAAAGLSAGGRPLLALGAGFLASRVVLYAVGVRFNLSAVDGPAWADPWQLLDRHLLQHHLLSSVWHLNSQPPLFNLLAGLVLKTPGALQEPLAVTLFVALGLVLVLSAYQTMADLSVPRWAAAVVAALVMADPAYLLFGNWFYYSYPTAALLAFVALATVRYLRTGRWSWGLGLFGAVAAVVLLDAKFQIEWFGAILLVVLVARRRQWRQVLAVAAVPIVLAGGWCVKDEVQFGSFTTSSWLGMNMYKITVVDAPRPVVASLVRQGKLTPLAEVFAFSPPSAYEPKYAAAPTGVPALDQTERSDGTPNFNSLLYVNVSRAYLHDDLAFVEAEPGRYASTLAKSSALWFMPSDKYFVAGSDIPGSSPNDQHLSTWSRLYDAGVLWQPDGTPWSLAQAFYTDQGPSPGQLSYQTIADYLIVAFGVPALVWAWRRRDRAGAGALVVVWVTVAYAFALTSLVEFGENERFRFELGPLPVIAAAVVITAAARRWVGRRAAAGGGAGEGGG